MDTCRCTSYLSYPFYQMGCIECGAACCPLCAFFLESATYCARCAELILEAPVKNGLKFFAV